MRKKPNLPLDYSGVYYEENPDRILPDQFRNLIAGFISDHAEELQKELEWLLQNPDHLFQLESPNRGAQVQRKLDVAIKLIEIEQDLRRARQAVHEIKNGWPPNRPYRRER